VAGSRRAICIVRSTPRPPGFEPFNHGELRLLLTAENLTRLASPQVIRRE
jgi:hypothetical protein